MKKYSNIIYVLALLILAFITDFALTKCNTNDTKYINTPIIKPKNIDSIQYNIIKLDSIIYDINHKIKEDENKIIELNDSDTIKLFYQLSLGK